MGGTTYGVSFRYSDLYAVCLKRPREFINGLLDFQALIQYAVEEVAMAVDAQYVKIMDIVPLLRTFWCGRGSGGRRELLVTKYSRSTCGRRPGVHT
jgi:hypothetical protein